MNKRILYVHPSVDRPCGPDNSLFELLKRLNLDTYEKWLLVLRKNSLVDKYLPYVYGVYESPLIYIPQPRGFNVISHLRHFLTYIQAVWEIGKLFRSHPFDIVHVNLEVSWHIALISKILGSKTIIHIRGMNSMDDPRKAKIIAKLLNVASDKLIAVSQEVAKAYIDAGVQQKKVVVINNGVDLSIFTGQSKQNRMRNFIPRFQSGPIIASIGSADPRKGWLNTIEAFGLLYNQHPNLWCLLIGGTDNGEKSDFKDGLTYLQVLRHRIEELGIGDRLLFTGPIDNMPDVYSSIKVLIQPSVNEAGPRAVLEAMASGIPVVATDLGGNRSYISHGQTGLLVEPNNPFEIARAVSSILDNEDMWRVLSLTSKKEAQEKFNIEETVLDIARLY